MFDKTDFEVTLEFVEQGGRSYPIPADEDVAKLDAEIEKLTKATEEGDEEAQKAMRLQLAALEEQTARVRALRERFEGKIKPVVYVMTEYRLREYQVAEGEARQVTDVGIEINNTKLMWLLLRGNVRKIDGKEVKPDDVDKLPVRIARRLYAELRRQCEPTETDLDFLPA